VRFVELADTVWSWGAKYDWEDGSPDTSIIKARTANLIADIN
jgi:hypothetical protein